MTDWEYVALRREKGESWSTIASDPKTGYSAPKGTDAGRALKTLYLQRKARRRTRGGEERPLAAGPSTQSRWTRQRWGVVVAIIVIVAVVGGGVGYLIYKPPTPAVSPIITYCGGEGTVWHYHVLLVIDDNGAQQPLPYAQGVSADIGYLDQPGFTNSAYYCPNSGIHALHTHDGSGILHIEFPQSIAALDQIPNLGMFFQIWGEPLDAGHVWTFSGHVTATMHDMNTGQTTSYSTDPASIPFYYPPGGPTSNPYTIPQNLIFNGQYGNGASGGTFDGEIIWLNVTSSGPAIANPGGGHPVGVSTPPFARPSDGVRFVEA